MTSASSPTNRATPAVALPPGIYRGECFDGYMYGPYMFALLPIMFANEMHALRLTSGRGNELATQATMIWYADTAPMGMRNIAKKRAGTLSVAVAMMLPTTDMSIRQAMWIDRSAVLPEVYVTNKDTRKVANQTGAVMRRVLTLLYPRVLTIVGKKYWNV